MPPLPMFVKEFFPTGTFVELRADTERTDYSLYADPYTETSLSLSLNQPLLRGFGRVSIWLK